MTVFCESLMNKDKYSNLDTEKHHQTDFCIPIPQTDICKVAYADDDNTLYVLHRFTGDRKARVVPVADFFSCIRI